MLNKRLIFSILLGLLLLSGTIRAKSDAADGEVEDEAEETPQKPAGNAQQVFFGFLYFDFRVVSRP